MKKKERERETPTKRNVKWIKGNGIVSWSSPKVRKNRKIPISLAVRRPTVISAGANSVEY